MEEAPPSSLEEVAEQEGGVKPIAGPGHMERCSRMVIGGLERVFCWWGQAVVRRPYPVILSCIALTALASLGFLNFRSGIARVARVARVSRRASGG